MVNFVEGVLKVPICVVAVAKHPPSDRVNDGFRAFSCSGAQRDGRWCWVRSADTVERAFATRRRNVSPRCELSHVFRARARMTGTHLLGDRLRVKGQWYVKEGRAGFG